MGTYTYWKKAPEPPKELCPFCGQKKDSGSFYLTEGQKICKDCVKRIFSNHFDLYTEQGEKEPERKALEKICMILNLYYSDEIVDHLKKYCSGIGWKRDIKFGYVVDSYIRYVTSTSQIKFKVYMKSYEDTILERFQQKNMQKDV